jgi:hypothetical protein
VTFVPITLRKRPFTVATVAPGAPFVPMPHTLFGVGRAGAVLASPAVFAAPLFAPPSVLAALLSVLVRTRALSGPTVRPVSCLRLTLFTTAAGTVPVLTLVAVLL